jgi:phenylalanine-4-hydroxylase
METIFALEALVLHKKSFQKRNLIKTGFRLQKFRPKLFAFREQFMSLRGVSGQFTQESDELVEQRSSSRSQRGRGII